MRTLLGLVICVSTVGVWACAPDSDGSEGSTTESAYTADGGDASTEAEAAAADAGEPVARVDVPTYGADEVEAKPKVRWSLDNAPVTEGYDPTLSRAATQPRPYRLEAKTYAQGGLPFIHVEFGRAGEKIAAGDYDCSTMEAIALVKTAPDVMQMTFVEANKPQRPCVVHIDSAEAPQATPGLPTPAGAEEYRYVRGRFEAVVGTKGDANSPTREIHGTFAVFTN